MEKTGFTKSMIMLLDSRKSMAFIFTWTATIGAIIAGRGLPQLNPTILSIISSLFITLAVYLYNDVVDREMDAASTSETKRGRPIAGGKVPVSDAMVVIYLFSVLGLVTAYVISQFAFIIALSFFMLFTLYSYPKVRFKRMFIIKSLVTSTGPSWTMILGGIAVSGILSVPLLFAAVVQAAFMFFVLPGLADSFDVKEDSMFGMKTLAMVLNWTQKVQMMIVAVVIVFLAGISGYSYIGFNVILPVSVTLFSLILIREMLSVLNGYEEKRVLRVRKVAYAYYTFIPVFMALGTLNLPFLL